MTEVFDLKTHNNVEMEAAAWIVQLDGKKPSKEDLAALREWSRRSPYHREAIKRLSVLWSDLDEMTALIDELPHKAEPATEDPIEPAADRKRRFPLGWAAACVFALALVLGSTAYFITQPEPGDATYTTAVGEQETAALPDGSFVRINTNTSIIVDYSAAERRIHLVHGEAMFEVKKNSHRPFVVEAGGSEIRAVGTAFSVQFENRALEVTVSEGIVDFTPSMLLRDNQTPADGPPARSARRVGAMQTVSFADGEIVVEKLEKETLSRTLAWRDGVLAFHGDSLEYVVHEVSRYNDVEFIFDDPAIKEIRIGGYFGVGEIDELLVALNGSFGVKSERLERGVIKLSWDEPA